jgi:hypothetical protein
VRDPMRTEVVGWPAVEIAAAVLAAFMPEARLSGPTGWVLVPPGLPAEVVWVRRSGEAVVGIDRQQRVIYAAGMP